MSARRTSGTSKPNLGAQILAFFSFISYQKSQFKKCLGRLDVPDILLPDVRGLLIDGPAIRNVNRDDSREPIRVNPFARNPLFSERLSDSRE